ncbi:hypothetical protein [Dehalococcoides mccartyi]|uniref:hypothetical protein n=1 Tax=Dehalococcoides mccartyi TaxID=61435 RepID=UPI0019D9C09A|nr:hypothetical protein [Dehalococcoides mccartyi]MBF4483181.1 hypothetical protein [Dehalococcoides mccartyi]MBJ7531734.1 hypothetical protein [Dehalococcoides mccartyi]
MTINKLILIFLIGGFTLSLIGCTPNSQTEEVPINRDIAIMIAKGDVPNNIIGEASIQTLWDESKWTVHFLLSGNNTVTKNEIGWPESPDNKFVNQGLLPADNYRLLTFTIDRRTGAVLSRQASDSVLLGGPGTFNTEPPEKVSLVFPLWLLIVSSIGGLVIGGTIVWLITHKRLARLN